MSKFSDPKSLGGLAWGKKKFNDFCEAVMATSAKMDQDTQSLAEQSVLHVLLHGSTARFCLSVEAVNGRHGMVKGNSSMRTRAFIKYVREVCGGQIGAFKEVDGRLSCKMEADWDKSKFALDLLDKGWYEHEPERVQGPLTTKGILERLQRIKDDITKRGDKQAKSFLGKFNEHVEQIKKEVPKTKHINVTPEAGSKSIGTGKTKATPKTAIGEKLKAAAAAKAGKAEENTGEKQAKAA